MEGSKDCYVEVDFDVDVDVLFLKRRKRRKYLETENVFFSGGDEK